MLSKFCLLISVLIASTTIWGSVRQTSALQLGQEKQEQFKARYNTEPSGSYRGGIWIYTPIRSSYGSFSGGGPGSGK